MSLRKFDFCVAKNRCAHIFFVLFPASRKGALLQISVENNLIVNSKHHHNKNTLWGICFITSTSYASHLFLLCSLKLNLTH